MRDLPEAFASHLGGGVTTLCRCWRLSRRDGVVTGFTDHDRDLVFGGLTYAAASGLAPSEAESQLGLATAGAEVSGALSAASITEVDIAAGRYDNAEVASYLVNWADVSQRLLLEVGHIGEIRRGDGHFTAELRGLAYQYDQVQGRLYTADCAADLGGSRCKVALARITIQGTVSAARNGLSFTVAALADKSAGWASGGKISFSNGPLAGLTRMIRAHRAGGALDLWEPLPHPPGIDAACTITAGCDKSFATCLGKFSNGDNFRGFPHIPTPDFVLTYARTGAGGYDGGALES